MISLLSLFFISVLLLSPAESIIGMLVWDFFLVLFSPICFHKALLSYLRATKQGSNRLEMATGHLLRLGLDMGLQTSPLSAYYRRGQMDRQEDAGYCSV